jgi:hypothetical protein
MNDQSHAAGGTRFLTVDEILSEHERLLAAHSAHADVPGIRAFVYRVEESGVHFDEASERKAIQGMLDYWTSELAKHPQEQDSTAQRRRSIREFDAEALKALQRDFANPFGGIADRLDALSKEDRRSPVAIVQLVADVAKTQNLRFQEGLLKEMVSQLTGDLERDSATQSIRDREDARLLEFCLWNLFEDPETRLGNKLYRPRRSGGKAGRVDFFSCKVYLARKADELFEGLGRPAAVLDALMHMDAGSVKAQRPQSFVTAIADKLEDLGQSVQAWLGSRSPQSRNFALYGQEGLSLMEFLQGSRLAFNEGGKWRMAHPALARWDPLKERRWKAAQRRRLMFLSSTAVLVAVATSLAWIGWHAFWTNLAMVHLAEAQRFADTNLRKRLAESVAGLWASNLSMGSDVSYASQVANDAIGAVIGQRAREGRGVLEDLKRYPSLPRVECGQIPSFGGGFPYSVTATPSLLRSVPMGVCPVFAVNLNGTRLAAAWEKNGQVTLRVFQIGSDFRFVGSGDEGALIEADLEGQSNVPWMRELHELALEPPLNSGSTRLEKNCKDRTLRFSEDDRIVSYECLYSVDNTTSSVQWIPVVVKDAGSEAASEDAVAGARKVVAEIDNVPRRCNGEAVESLPPTSRITSVFLGPRGGSGSGFVTVRGDGYVQIWHDDKQPPCLSAQFRADFVRVGTAGRPAALDVQDVGVPRAVYAVYALSPTPVVRVYEQRQAEQATLRVEHYPPAGVGTPVGIKFTTDARCLQIRASRRHSGELVSVDYYLILDAERLLAVGRALEKDLGSEAPSENRPLEEYSRAIEKQCYAA